MFFETIKLPPAVTLAAQIIVGIAMIIALARIAKGPSIPDRIIALDLFSALIMAQLTILVFIEGFIAYLDIAAAIAIISFLATVALARYLESEEAPL